VRAVLQTVRGRQLEGGLLAREFSAGLRNRLYFIFVQSRGLISSRRTKDTCPIGMLCVAEIPSPG
jgi:hypothetical protein